MSKDGWATIGVGVALLTVLVTVAGIVLEGQSALRAEIADLRAEFAAFRKELRAENAEFRKDLGAENAAFGKDLRAENVSFRKDWHAENIAFHKDLSAENAAFQKDLRAENAAFHKAMRAENAELRKELRAEIGAVAEQTAQLRDRVTRLEVLVGVVVERLMPSDGVAELTGDKLSGHP